MTKLKSIKISPRQHRRLLALKRKTGKKIEAVSEEALDEGLPPLELAAELKKP